MANSATVGALRVLLSADTAQFEKALAGADASTKKLANTMKRDLEPSQARINSLIRQFEGTQAKGTAEAYAQAITKVGGVTKLTAQHQEQANIALQKALAHYKALGQQAPPHILSLQTALKGVDKPMAAMGSNLDMVGSKLKSLAGLFGVTIGAAAIGGFIRSTFMAAEQIVDLSDKMGVSVEAAQRFKFAANQAGAEIDDVSRAILKMNDNLAEGNKSTVKALDDVGLKFTDIRAMKPEQAFRTIADAIQGIADPMKQTQVAMQLFGKSGVEMLGMIRTGALKAADGITVMSTDAAKRLEQAKENWDNWIGMLTIGSAEGIASLLRLKSAFGALADQITSLKGVWEFAKFMTTAVAKGNSPQMAFIATLLAAEVKSNPGAQVGPDSLFMKAGATGSGSGKRGSELTDEQKKYNDEIARGVAIWTGAARDGQIKKLADQFKALGSAQKIIPAEMAKLRDELNQLVKDGGKLDPVLEKIRQQGLAPLFPNLHKDTLSFQELTKNAIKAADIFKQAPPDFVKFLPTELAPQWANGLMGMFGKPGAGSVVQEGKATISMLQVMNHSMATTSQLMNALATSSSGAMRTVSKVMGFAADSVFDLGQAFKSAKGDMNAFANSAAVMSSGMSFATLGIGMIIDDINRSIEASKAAKAQFRQMREEVKSLGVTVDEFNAIVKGRNAKGLGLAFDEDKSLKFLKEAKTGIENLTGAAVDFGGVLPRSLQPAIQEFLKIQNLPATFRAQLEALTGAPSWKVLEERAQALGIDKGALGAGFNQAKQKDIALGFVRDLNMFADAGADVDAVLRGMADELSLLMLEAMKTGAALPKTLEPYLAKLSKMNLLLDENGNAIDMGALSFMDFEDEALEAMKDLLTEIKDILAKAFPAAADAATQAIKKLSGGLGGLFKGGGGESAAGGGGSLSGTWVPPDMSSTASLTPSMAASFDESSALSGPGQQTSTFIFQFDERALARSTVSYLPGETKRLGLNRV